MNIYNPNKANVDELPVIYGFSNNPPSDECGLEGLLLAQDGTFLGGHLCSSEAWMKTDLGIVGNHRPDRHKDFIKHYPDGYRMEFVPYSEIDDHVGLMTVIQESKRRARGEES